jgi:hypothetical protein
MVRERLKGIFMEPKTLRQIRGAKDLVEETIDAAALAINEVQRTMTRMPYALLARIEPIAAPVQAIEQVHLKIADSVYFSIRVGNRLVGNVAGFMLDQLDAHAQRKGHS